MDTIGGGRPPDIDHLAPALGRWLRASIVVALVSSAGGTVAGGQAGRVAAIVAVTVIVAAPLARVAYLGTRWARIGDRRFAYVAFALLGVIALGALAVLLT